MMALLVNAVRDMDKSSRVCYNGARHKSDSGNIVKAFLNASITLDACRKNIYIMYIFYENINI